MKKRGGVYVYRTRKHHAVVGLPIIGRHVGYVGETNSFSRRDAQHLKGGGQYQSVAKPWADLSPKCYRLGLPDWKWLRLLVEAVLIWVLCPVYNVKGQGPWNLRRVSLKRAKAQRFVRDQFGLTGRLMAAGIRVLVWVLVGAAVLGIWSVTR